MENSLNIAIIQTTLVWENREQNRKNFSEKIYAISQEIDLIILPEMFTTGFTVHAESNAETMEGSTVTWLKNLAKEKNCAIIGSLIIADKVNYFNRLVFTYPTGDVKTYDKRHTFTLAGEDKVYTAGRKKLIVEYKGWKICPLICYDLRFPVWTRNTDDYDLLIYLANWPKPRINAWNTLLKARAIENMTYCVGVNRIGRDKNGFEYNGNSKVYDSLGIQISTIKPNDDITEIIQLDKQHLIKTREKFRFLDDRDDFLLTSEKPPKGDN